MTAERGKLRVFALSHAAVVAVNQEPFDALARAGAEVTIGAPRALGTDLRGRLALERLPGSAAAVVPLRVDLGGYRTWLGGQRGIHVILYRGLARAIARARPEVVFVEEEPYALAAWQAARVCARRRIPMVVHQNQNIPRALPPLFARVRRRVLARAAGATVRNAAAESILRDAGFSGPMTRFPHAVDPARFTGATPPALGLPAPVVGYVGRLVEEKGVMDLIEALAGSGASLLAVGDGPLYDAAQARAAERGVPATFPGAIPHDAVPPLYAAMDVVAVPSRATPTWTEQFGRIVIEANAAGVPVVVSDAGELPATVAATGGGVVAAAGDAAALREALTGLLGDPARRRALGEAGRSAVAARFTPDAVARHLLEFLRGVAA